MALASAQGPADDLKPRWSCHRPRRKAAFALTAEVACALEEADRRPPFFPSGYHVGIGDRSPLVNGVQAGKGFEGDVGAQHAREVDTSSLNKVSSDGKHCNTAVLELGSPEPVEGLIGADLRVSKRVKLLKGGSAARHTFESGADGGGGLRREKKMQ